MNNTSKTFIILALILVVSIPLWLFVIVPKLVKMPSDFTYRADIVSSDNFYDEAGGVYTGESLSKTKFSYGVESAQDGVLTVKNVFDVRTVNDDPIFVVERIYGIDQETGAHVAGFGDKERDGYLFAPRGLKRGEPFTYWHINYDGPAHMEFVGEEDLRGLSVYKYETRYEEVDIDQTNNLSHLPGVPETRGVNLEPHLQVWVEPVSGRMVKYEDKTVAYFYNQATKDRLHPWNSFHNRYTDDSVARQVRNAQNAKQTIFLYEWLIPMILGVIALAFFVGFLLSRRVYQQNEVMNNNSV